MSSSTARDITQRNHLDSKKELGLLHQPNYGDYKFLPNSLKAFLLKGQEMPPVLALPTYLLLFNIFWISFYFVLICVGGKCDCEGDVIVFSQVFEVTLHHWDEVLLCSSYGRAKTLPIRLLLILVCGQMVAENFWMLLENSLSIYCYSSLVSFEMFVSRSR